MKGVIDFLRSRRQRMGIIMAHFDAAKKAQKTRMAAWYYFYNSSITSFYGEFEL